MTSTSTSGRPSRPNIVFGLILVAIGMTFLLHNFGVHYFEEFWTLWPLLLVALGLAKSFGGRADERTFGWILTFIGVVFFMRISLGWHVSLGDWWPMILVLIGVSIVMRSIQGPKPPAEVVDGAATVRERALIGGIGRKNSSQSFQGGELTAVMGGCEIDLRDARMAGPQAVLDCFVMWGAIVIQIPPDWAIDSHVSVFAAGFDDKSKPPVQPAGRLVIRGTAVMGGIEIKN